MDNTLLAVLMALIVSVIAPLLTLVVKGWQEREGKQQEYEHRQSVEKKLDVIKADVNSNMTTSMQNEYDSLVRESVLMREVTMLRGGAIDLETQQAMDSSKAKIKELGALLEARKAGVRVNVG